MQLNPLGGDARPRGRLRRRRVADRFHLREAVTTLEDTVRIARRVFGGAHPLAMQMGNELHKAQAKLRAREAPPSTA